MFLIAFSFAIAIAYVWWASNVFRGWNEYTKRKSKQPIEILGISIVIPFRNEAKNLYDLLESIATLDYPKERLEVILVNDNSDDNGVEIINEWNANSSFQVKLVQAKFAGKKAAQYNGVKAAQFNIVACTDADCVIPKKWLINIASSFQNPKLKLVFGPVGFIGVGHKFQRLEFLSLIGSTMAMLQNSLPVMGNAANMAFRKESFFVAFPNLELRKTTSGDDVFLLHEVAKERAAIGVLAGRDSVVKTKPQENLRALFSQRLRWASKASLYRNKVAISVALLVFFVNVLAMLLAIGSFFFANALYGFLMLMLVKITADFVLIKRFSSFYNEKMSLVNFLLLELINLIYIPVIAIASQLLGFTWKGRKS